jgi:hypothetical protein
MHSIFITYRHDDLRVWYASGATSFWMISCSGVDITLRDDLVVLGINAVFVSGPPESLSSRIAVEQHFT